MSWKRERPIAIYCLFSTEHLSHVSQIGSFVCFSNRRSARFSWATCRWNGPSGGLSGELNRRLNKKHVGISTRRCFIDIASWSPALQDAHVFWIITSFPNTNSIQKNWSHLRLHATQMQWSPIDQEYNYQRGSSEECNNKGRDKVSTEICLRNLSSQPLLPWKWFLESSVLVKNRGSCRVVDTQGCSRVRVFFTFPPWRCRQLYPSTVMPWTSWTNALICWGSLRILPAKRNMRIGESSRKMRRAFRTDIWNPFCSKCWVFWAL